MTRDLRKTHRLMWWVLPPLLVLLLWAATTSRLRAERALRHSENAEAGGTR